MATSVQLLVFNRKGAFCCLIAASNQQIEHCRHLISGWWWQFSSHSSIGVNHSRCTMAENGTNTANSTLEAAGNIISNTASQAQAAVTSAAQTVKAAVSSPVPGTAIIFGIAALDATDFIEFICSQFEPLGCHFDDGTCSFRAQRALTHAAFLSICACCIPRPSPLLCDSPPHPRLLRVGCL